MDTCSASPGNISNSKVSSTLNNKASQLRTLCSMNKGNFSRSPVSRAKQPTRPPGSLRLATRDPQPLAAPAGAWCLGSCHLPAPGFFPTCRSPSALRPGQAPTRTLSARSTARSPGQGHRATRKHSGPPLVQTNTVTECPLYDTRTLPWSLQPQPSSALERPCRTRRATAKSLARGLHKHLTWRQTQGLRMQSVSLPSWRCPTPRL